MSSRGRGYGGYNNRGNYSGRGSSYRGSYRGSGNRGSYEGRGGGRGGYSYDSRFSGGSGGRYTNRDRIDESHKKSYRPESSNYSSREYGGRTGSPDRKRMRVEGSSDRRSHDGGGHYYSSRQDNYPSERRSYGEERRRSASRERVSYRKSMAPPRSPLRSRVSRPPRRSFRGRSLRTRGFGRGSLRSRGSFVSRRYSDKPLSYTRAFRSTKPRSIVKDKDEASTTEEEWDPEDKEDEVTEKETKPKSPKEEEEEVADEVEEEDEVGGAETEREEGEEETGAGAATHVRPVRKGYVQLTCVHCKERYATFSGYSKHLMSMKHRSSMSAVARRHKAQLLRMRVAQRGAQRSLEAAAGAELATRTTFCLVCRLNHRTTRHAHNATDSHRAMKRFLLPFCRVCRLTFRSPMIYEHHICSLEHLKRKASQNSRKPSPKPEGSGDEGMDVDLDNFMTLDSVGDVDEVDDEDSGTEKKEDSAAKKPKVEINIGSEHIKKVEVHWCSLCRVYVSRGGGGEEEAEAVRRHCRLRLHLRRYVQHRDTRTLRKHAERIHRQLHQTTGQEADKSGNTEEKIEKIKTEKDETVEDKTTENGVDANHATDDKLWADVDKDIGEFLREVDPQCQDGSDDEEDLGRYDKFRKSDKVLKDTTDAEDGATVTENGEEKNETVVEAAE